MWRIHADRLTPHRELVTPELVALLALQEQDEAIDAVHAKLDALTPRIAELERRLKQATDAVERAQATLVTEEQRQAYLRDKVTEHKSVLERNQAALDQVKTMRAATAAVSQLEQVRRVLADEESDLATVTRKLAELRMTVEASDAAVHAVQAEQTEARAEIEAERAVIAEELAAAEAVRSERAAAVAKAILLKYDRIRLKKRPRVVYPLNAGACSACDTSIPVQRKYTMQNTGSIELCEACGVLLYASA